MLLRYAHAVILLFARISLNSCVRVATNKQREEEGEIVSIAVVVEMKGESPPPPLPWAVADGRFK